MIRYVFINNIVLQIYKNIPKIVFPLDVCQVIALLPNCRFVSYQDFAEQHKCNIEDVIQFCQSESGCTHYDVDNERYLIMCNQSFDNNNNSGRQRWTCSHEVGHIVCKHFQQSAYMSLTENGFENLDKQFESEADYFAATLLSPLPLFKILNVQSQQDIQRIFGLSDQASFYRFQEYERWKKGHRKTSWDNDIVNLYKLKCQNAV